MQYFGYDNITFSRRLSDADIDTLYLNLPQLWQVAGVYALRAERVWLQRSRRGELLVNVNVPKVVRGSNVQLSGPADLEVVLRLLESETGLSFEEADVRSVHLALTWEGDVSSEELSSILRVRKGYSKQREGNTTYLNASNRQIVLAVYDKLKHLRDRAKSATAREFVYANALPKLELRLESKVRKQLKAKGLWTHNTLLARDLATPQCFEAFKKLFADRAESFLAPCPKVTFTDEGLALLAILRSSPRVFKRVIGTSPVKQIQKQTEALADRMRALDVHAQVRSRIRALKPSG